MDKISLKAEITRRCSHYVSRARMCRDNVGEGQNRYRVKKSYFVKKKKPVGLMW